MLKRILLFLQTPCKNCHDWIVLGFCRSKECKFYKLRFSGGVLCGKYFLSIQTDQSVH